MSAQFYSVLPNAVQNAMGGTHMHHTPQSIFPHTMNNPTMVDQHNKAPWLNVPHVPPMSMPWSIPSLQQPDLVRFTGQEPLMNLFQQSNRSFKRRLETPDVVDTRPAKQFITEEKMTQHFKGLQISPNALNAQSAGPSTLTSDLNPDLLSSCDLDLESSSSLDVDAAPSGPKLVLSEELKKLTEEPIIPTSLLSKLERPSMALVLWEPPCKHLGLLSAGDNPTPSTSDDNNNDGMSTDDGNNNNNDSNANNNNETIPNLNQTMDVNIADPTLEPMDL